MKVLFNLKRKRVRVFVGFQVGKNVIDMAMMGLICTDIIDQVHEGGIRFHVPILDRDFGSGDGLPVLQAAGLDFLKTMGVSFYGFDFQTGHQSEAELGREQETEEVKVPENGLRQSNHEAHEQSGLADLQKSEEMHALVLCLSDEAMDPSTVALHRSQRTQMADRRPAEAWHAGDRLEEDHAREPAGFGGVELEAGEHVKVEADHADGQTGNSLAHVFRPGPFGADTVELLFSPLGMRQ